MSTTLPNGDSFDHRAIELPAGVDSVPAVVRLLIESLVHRGVIPSAAIDELVRDVLKREELGSTATGRGVALPHAQCEFIAEPYFALGTCPMPMRWPNALDGEPVSRVCLFLSPKSQEMRKKSLEIAASLLRS